MKLARLVIEYAADARQDEKRATQDRVWDLWLDCWTQQAIADELGVDDGTLSRWLSQNGMVFQNENPPPSHASTSTFRSTSGWA